MNLKPGCCHCRPKHGVCARFAPSAVRWQEFGLDRREGGGAIAHAAERQHLDTYPQQLQPRAVPATKASRVRSSSAAITQHAVVMMKQVKTRHAACWRFLCIMECTSRIALLAPPRYACAKRVIRPWLYSGPLPSPTPSIPRPPRWNPDRNFHSV